MGSPRPFIWRWEVERVAFMKSSGTGWCRQCVGASRDLHTEDVALPHLFEMVMVEGEPD